MANISKTLEQDLRALNMNYLLYDEFEWSEHDQEYSGTPTGITIYDYNNGIDFKSFRIPKTKEVNVEWVMNKWNIEQAFVNFSNKFKELLEKEGILNSLICYPTSYGIGIFVKFSYRNTASQLREKIDMLLTERNIEFRNEYSDAGWVFRYIISKKKENIDRL